MAKKSTLPPSCESGCGPATHEDEDGVPLCKACYEALEVTETQHRAMQAGFYVVEGGKQSKGEF